MDLATDCEFSGTGERESLTADNANHSRDHYLAEVQLVKVSESVAKEIV